tara:strand:+ start:276 stop:578 length:303 start_codon:yes stop_codon:yes gene_type:complete
VIVPITRAELPYIATSDVPADAAVKEEFLMLVEALSALRDVKTMDVANWLKKPTQPVPLGAAPTVNGRPDMVVVLPVPIKATCKSKVQVTRFPTFVYAPP